MSSMDPPLCVDLDGTLVLEDTLVVTLRHLLRKRPWLALALPFVVLRGRPAFKGWLADRYVPDPANLTWREDVLEFVRAEHSRGRRLVLATAAHDRVAQAVASHLGLFDRVVATTGSFNAKGRLKVVAIAKSLNDSEFDYIGDSRADLPVFRAARRCYLVAPEPSFRQEVESVARVAGTFGPDRD